MTKAKAGATLLGFQNMLTAALGETSKEEEQFQSQPQTLLSPFRRMLEATEHGGKQAYVKTTESMAEHSPQTFENESLTAKRFLTLYSEHVESMIKKLETNFQHPQHKETANPKTAHQHQTFPTESMTVQRFFEIACERLIENPKTEKGISTDFLYLNPIPNQPSTKTSRIR
jgi:hypothetical protein